MHSFTPVFQVERPWYVGVLWDRDRRVPLPLWPPWLEEPGLIVGDNEPYTGRNRHGYTIPMHAEARGLAMRFWRSGRT